MSKVYIADSPIHGKGVFAAVTIRPGEPILTIDDSRLVTENSPLRSSLDEHRRYCDFLADNTIVLMQPPERYINHCCGPNAFVKTIDGTRYVLAIKTIYMTEEITYDYAINSRGDTIWLCNCGSTRCRHTVYSDFFSLPYLLRLEYLPLLDEWFVEENRDRVKRLLDKALT
jgi:SET domain-containing protein